MLDESNFREGNGATTKSARMRGYMRKAVRELSERLNVEIEIVEDSSTLSGKRAKAKGFFDKKTGKVTVVLPNNTSIADIEETVLHETVAHYGLRKLFGDQFDVFLEKVFDNANESIRRQIVALASKYKWDFRKATEEYLATLAEDKNIYGNKIARWLETIRRLFLNMLQRFGFKYSGAKLNLNDLRYVLWASYQNLQGAMPLFKEAADIAKRFELGVGEFAASGNRSAVKVANERFNKELERYLDGEMNPNEILHLGIPLGAMQSFLPKLPIVIRQRILSKASEKKHNVDISSLQDMPKHLAEPIFIFQRDENTIGVLTEIKDKNGRNVCVAIEMSKTIQAGGNFLEVNDIRSIHGRRVENIIFPIIQNGTLQWVDKTKGLNWLSSASPNVQQEIDKKDLDSVAKIIENFENPTIEDEILFGDGDPAVQERALARDRYEKRMRSQFFQSQEALQDSMLSLKEAMKLILGKKWKSIEDVHGHENAYLGENRLSSVNKAEADAFGRLLFKPLLDAVAKLAPNRDARTELTDYMFAKHGLERNRVMAEKYAQQAIDDGDVRPYAEIYAEYRNRDYAGLTALTGLADVAAAEAEAQQMVDEYEAKHDTKELWKRINRVSNAILEKSFESGLISEETYKKISDMYEFYIPLRGFDEKTSEDAYTYLTHKDSAFNAPIVVTRGRKSIADDPLAYLQSMAESTIMQGNRNMLVKQRFLNFVLHHPSDLVSVSELWVEYDEVHNEWKPVFPDNIGANDSAEEVQRKMQDFEAKMEELRKQDPKRYKKGSDAANVPYRIVRKEHLNEHQIIVKRGGRDVILTINGNPRLAQALNGLTNPDNDLKNSLEIIAKGANYVNRQLSLFYTSRNPDFIVSNFLRDMLYTNTMVWVKESPNYALRFHKNVGKANIVQMRILYAKYRNNKLNMNNDMEKMFYQFMMNGGETGYTNVKDIEQRKKDIQKLIRQAAGKLPIGTALNLLDEQFDELNRAVENSARFAAFMTSREMGRTIDRAIYDAKEISVNFNKKGSGDRMLESNRGLGKASSVVSWFGRSAYVFWNAAIQGTTNFGRQVKRHPLKALATVATYFLLGMIIAALGDDDDEDNSYYNIPDYIRRSNILFRAGNSWVSIPLPIEFRPVYGMGELAMSTLSGKERYSDGELAWKIAGQMSQILPLDFLEGGGGWHAFVPSIAKPAVEAQANTSWTGLPIYKETPFNKNMPNWTKAYSTSNQYIVNLTKALNEASGGDAYTKGSVDLNPAKIEYMLNGYFSGLTGTVDKLVKMGETAFGDREYDPRNFLLLNRVVKNGDERTEIKAVNNSYWELKKEYDELKKRLKNYKKDTDSGVFDYAEKIDFIHNSPEYARYLIFDEYRRDINYLTEQLDEAKENNDEEAYQEIEIELNEKKKELVTRAGETYK